ncbi:major facilitator superfamily domain-containing protein 8-like [Dendronephthya gigantea]|uniref:major facilitator superfamily domain-containing protein 8-like n=1 Tax=Dendronephthya gigantea TaxID=151771 RepID=UPI00106B3ABA|nr:major facilitator superfamily domain-containing protein 8-like [Dendronephthya gigantea]
MVFIYISLRFFSNGVEEYLIQPTAWYYMKFLKESNVFLGLTLASYSAATLVFSPFFGALNVRLQNSSKLIILMGGVVKLLGNMLYSIPINGYFPMFGRFLSGMGTGTGSVLFGIIAKGSSHENRAQAFLYFEALFFAGQVLGPTLGSILTFNVDIFGWQINAGNSPGVIMMIIWCFLLTFTIFLPSNLTEENIEEKQSKEIIVGEKITDTFKSSSETNNIFRPPSIVFSLFYFTFVLVIFYSVVGLYVPLLAAHRLGLGLLHVKLIFINSTLFVFILFILTPLFLRIISEKNLLILGKVFLMFPIFVLLYFSVSWNTTLSVNAAYLLPLTMFILEGNAVNFSLICSILTKLTPVSSASFYQGINFAVLHFGIMVGRLIAGATFAKLPMMYAGFGLTVCWLFSMLWLSIEYKNFPRDIEHQQ